MVKKKADNVLSVFDLPPADEVVADILGDNARKEEEMRLTSKERKALNELRRKGEQRKAQAALKAATQAKNRQQLLLPVALKDDLTRIAEWHKTTISQVVTFLLYEAVRQYHEGKIDFGPYKTASYNARYDAELIHPNDTERLERRSAQKRKKGWG